MPTQTHPASDDLEERSRTLAAALGLCAANDVVSVTPFVGGPASEIGLMDLGD